MSTTCTQSSHMRHPWFHNFATKRKVAPPDDRQRPVKRRRYSTLEHGFAHLTLTHDLPISEDTDVPMDSDMMAPEVFDDVARPSSVEEPSDIRMRTSTWYEPEPDRIVVTELDSSDEEQDPRPESESELEKQDEGQFFVSPALLNRIRSRTLDSSLNNSPRSWPVPLESRAVVLFRPLQLPDNTGSSHTVPTSSTAPDDNAYKSQSSDLKEDDIMDMEP